MRNPTVPEIDHDVDKWVGFFCGLIAFAAFMSKAYPYAAVASLAAIAVGVVVVIGHRERKALEAFIADWTDTDSRLADVAIANTERPA